MYVKIMSDKNRELGADHRPYSLYTNVKHVHFERLEGHCQAHITFVDGEPVSVGIFDHVYVMNDRGETISRFDPGSGLTSTPAEVIKAGLKKQQRPVGADLADMVESSVELTYLDGAPDN